MVAHSAFKSTPGTELEHGQASSFLELSLHSLLSHWTCSCLHCRLAGRPWAHAQVSLGRQAGASIGSRALQRPVPPKAESRGNEHETGVRTSMCLPSGYVPQLTL